MVQPVWLSASPAVLLNRFRSYAGSRRLPGFLVIQRRIAPSAPPEQRVRGAEQSEMLDHHQCNHALYDRGRQRHMRRKVIQNDAVTGDQNDYPNRQHPTASAQATMSSHRFAPLTTMAGYLAQHGTFARTNCKSRNPTAPLSTLLK